MSKHYDIFLDHNKIGTTELEFSDPPMGVVFGKINFINIDSGYQYLKSYCLIKGIHISHDEPDERLLITGNIPNIKVINQNGVEISGEGLGIEGMDSDKFDITIIGIPHLLFEEEFPHHVKTYNDRH